MNLSQQLSLCYIVLVKTTQQQPSPLKEEEEEEELLGWIKDYLSCGSRKLMQFLHNQPFFKLVVTTPGILNICFLEQ